MPPKKSASESPASDNVGVSTSSSVDVVPVPGRATNAGVVSDSNGPVGGGVKSNTSTRPPGDVTVTKCGMVVWKLESREWEAERLGEPSALAESIVGRGARAREFEAPADAEVTDTVVLGVVGPQHLHREARDRRLHVEVRRLCSRRASCRR